MRTLLWVAAWSAVALWSLVSWGAYGFFGLFASAMRTAGGGDVEGFPVEPFSVAWAMDIVQSLGGAVFFMVWATVALFILGATWLLTALFTRRPASLPPLDAPVPPGPRPSADGLFDRMDRFVGRDRTPPRG